VRSPDSTPTAPNPLANAAKVPRATAPIIPLSHGRVAVACLSLVVVNPSTVAIRRRHCRCTNHVSGTVGNSAGNALDSGQLDAMPDRNGRRWFLQVLAYRRSAEPAAIPYPRSVPASLDSKPSVGCAG
jgi:hypothetical protein